MVLYLYTADLAAKLATLLPPESAVVVDNPSSGSYGVIGGDGITPLEDICAQLGIEAPSKVILGGFSAGCQGVRAWANAGFTPDIALAADGIHASDPPTGPQSEGWQRFKTLAESGQMAFGVSYSQVNATTFLPTRESIRRILGVDTSRFGPPTDPAVQCSGRFCAYGGTGSDGAAHLAQRVDIMPLMLANALSGRGSMAGVGKLLLGATAVAAGVAGTFYALK